MKAALIIAAILGYFALASKRKYSQVSEDLEAGKVSAAVDLDFGGVNVSGGILNLPLTITLNNASNLEAEVENLFVKTSIMKTDGTKSFLAQSAPDKTAFTLKPYSAQTIKETVQAPVADLAMNVLSIMKMKGISVELHPTVAGFNIPVIEQSFELNLKDLLFGGRNNA